MKIKLYTRQKLLLCFLLLSFISYSQVDEKIDVTTFESFEVLQEKIANIRFVSPDSAIELYQASYEHFLSKKNYLSAVHSLVELAIVHGHKAEYQEAYDNLWQALLLADENDNILSKRIAYLHLGRYYSFYKREKQALKYYQEALNLCKKLVNDGALPITELSTHHYAFASTYRELEMPDKVKISLDSAYHYHNLNKNATQNGYLDFEASCLKGANGNPQGALDQLFEIQSWFQQNNPGFQTLLFSYMGDWYVELNDATKAESYYKQALDISEKFKSHLDFKPLIYERLSKLYLKNNDFEKAYAALQKEKELDMLFFDSRSKNNAGLLQIKDDFRTEKEKQKLAQLEQERKVRWLQTLLLIITIVFLVFSGLIYFNYVRNKHKAEKELLRKKRELEVKQRELEIKQSELEIKQGQELLELKNKELAASSLKLIEKEELLGTLKKKLSEGKGDMKAADLKKIVRSISLSNAQNWEEFEMRFISVNQGFFEKLSRDYPKLTRGDLKLCSLIKLNLTSKEMAKLMGISVESVHTNRYRLRRKLKLTKDVSLTEFVAKL
jgi:tetratricopeptide (TPR) repeat protein